MNHHKQKAGKVAVPYSKYRVHISGITVVMVVLNTFVQNKL